MSIEKLTYYVEAWCRDGDHEYTDRFCITAPDLDKVFEPKDDAWDLVEQTILTWNFGGCEWDEILNTYTDGDYRHISLEWHTKIDKKNVDAVVKHLPNHDLSFEFAEQYESLFDKTEVA
tara:strand:- start:99 stop:455 length:357 start_codon:yes stop_codon:yes gene_type:complete